MWNSIERCVCAWVSFLPSCLCFQFVVVVVVVAFLFSIRPLPTAVWRTLSFVVCLFLQTPNSWFWLRLSHRLRFVFVLFLQTRYIYIYASLYRSVFMAKSYNRNSQKKERKLKRKERKTQNCKWSAVMDCQWGVLFLCACVCVLWVFYAFAFFFFFALWHCWFVFFHFSSLPRPQVSLSPPRFLLLLLFLAAQTQRNAPHILFVKQTKTRIRNGIKRRSPHVFVCAFFMCLVVVCLLRKRCVSSLFLALFLF